jgi:hypothetical protein
MYRIFKVLFLFLVCTTIQARPVSYPEGWTFMTMNDGDRYSSHIHYSPTASYSLGYKAEYWRDNDYQIHAFQINNLIKRWNKRHSQANLYLKSGLGLAYSDKAAFDSKKEFAIYTGLAADWETRRYFVSYENRFTEAGDITDNFRQKARIGIAPYIAEFGNIHTWLMLEVLHAPEEKESFVATPLLRIFKGPNLAEGGISSEGKILFNFVHRF